MTPDTILTLTIEKPAAGGRMLARHEGRVVLVSGAIPGERVRARVEHAKGGVLHAAVVDIEEASPDRRQPDADPLCGGDVLAHVAYPRQLDLKAAIVADAFARLAKLPLDRPLPVRPSPEHGYRMRARLHARGGRIGFFREGTHELCDAGSTRQLLDPTADLLDELAAAARAVGVTALREIEISENVPATGRALLLEVAPGTPDREIAAIGRLTMREGVTGVVVMRPEQPRVAGRGGDPQVSDTLTIAAAGHTASLTVCRHVASFFQGNRYLLGPLVETVVDLLPRGRLVELYAGVGLFGLAFAVLGRGSVTSVEGDRQAASDLTANARPLGSAVRVVSRSVETFLEREALQRDATILVDPPRTGMSRDAARAIAAAAAPRIAYVSCDVATLARDARRLIDAGYRLRHIEGFDLFPNTAHVEVISVFER